MKVVTLAAYLDRGNAGPGAVPLTVTAAPLMTREEEIAEARRDSERLGREAAQREHEEALQAAQQRFEARLAEERQLWTREQGDALARALGDGLTQIEAEIAEVTARLLEPFILAEARRKTLVELQETLRDMLADPETATLRIEGPADLIAALREGIGSKDNLVTFQVSERPDVHVETGNTVIETRLAAWTTRLKEAMG
ncbi:hypothetical protein [Taklimakanibacter albus]|uniref:Uncharacterized protein n=1 Tax=Taklimakanibacter albus TaxID=2800327 RepID=A0ACC5RAG6_9HYPH|nr:hypothetical protein [Aestuariivirga sp. YIM B02566]MBK1869637.1 hypothetical protein [Aestuariivirga sp. YIM B02566]